MKIVSYKLIVLLFISAFYTNAQEKKYYKEFKVNPNVVIDVNTRHADIEIETWNKDKVVIEAFMVVEGAEVTNQVEEDFYENWEFKVSENNNNIKIKSRTDSNINIYSLDMDSIDYESFIYPLANFSIGSLDVLDSLDFMVSPLSSLPTEFPEFPEFPEISLPSIPKLPSEFDFEAYKKDKTYLERWKKENKDFIGENTEINIGDDSIIINSDNKTISLNGWINKEEYIKNIVAEKQRYKKEIKKHKEEYLKERKKQIEERALQVREIKEEIKKNLKSYKNQRIKVQKILKERSKLKIKKVIKIKAPKKAKLNMDVKYGTLSFAN